MKTTTLLTIRRFSILLILFLFSTAVLIAQVRIKERVEINTKSNRTLKANASSNELPYFVGSLIPNDFRQGFTVLRPCKMVCAATVEGEKVGISIEGAGFTNRTDTIDGRCGWVDCRMFFGSSCGSFNNVNVSGNVSSKSVIYNITGIFSDCARFFYPFTASITFQAITSGGEPSAIAMSAIPTSLDANDYGDAVAGIYATACDDEGNPISYCDPLPMVITIENPINGTYLQWYKWSEDLHTNVPDTGSSYTTENPGGVRFYWNKSDLPNRVDTMSLSIKAECLGVSGTQKILLKKPIPDHFTIIHDAYQLYAGESVSIRAIAKDINDEEIAFGGGKSITFSDESGTGSFIVGSDTIPTEAIVTYSQAKSGSINYYSKLYTTNLVDGQYVWIEVYRTEFPERNGWGTIDIMPPCPVVTLSKSKISPGDKTTVTVMAHTAQGDFPYSSDQVFIASMDADAQYGKLRCTGDEGSYISGQQPFEFIAADSIDVDSIVVNITVSPVSNGGGGGGATSIKDGQNDTHPRQAVLEKKIAPSKKGAVPIEGDTKNALTVLQSSVMKKLAEQNNVLAQKVAKKQTLMSAITEAIKTQKAGKGDAASAKQLNAMVKALAEGDQCEESAEVTIKNFKILLGESKYYYATLDPNDPNNLIINETTTEPPALGPGLSNATFDDPVASSGSEKNPVYWEKKDKTGAPLPSGMIRLVGRYWENGKTFKTELTVHADGKSSSIKIEVKKPVRLGTTVNSTVEDVFGKQIVINDTIIKYAGLFGIPPQIIKGHIFTESDPKFTPSYRYEPWQDIKFQKNNKQEYFGNGKNFVVDSNSMGSGPSIPSTTSHCYITPNPPGNYIRSPIRIRNYLADNPGQYINKDKVNNKVSFMNDASITSCWQKVHDDVTKSNPKQTFNDRMIKSLHMTMDSLRNKLCGKNEYDWFAQTRIMASYGFLQMTFFNASDKPGPYYGFSKTSSAQPPEYLNDESYGFPAYGEKMICMLKKKIGDDLPLYNWTDGFEKTWLKVLDKYNPGEGNYEIKVMGKAKDYQPANGE